MVDNVASEVAAEVTIRHHVVRIVGDVRVRRSSPVGISDIDAAFGVVVDFTIQEHEPRAVVVERERRS